MAAVTEQHQQFPESLAAGDMDGDHELSDATAADEDEEFAKAVAAADEHDKNAADESAAAEEHDQKLTEVLAILGDTVDPDVVRTMLESVNWDVQVVVNNLLEGVATPTAAAEPQSTRQSPSISPRMDHDQLMKMSVKELRKMLDARKVDHSTCVEKQDLVRMLEENWDVEVEPEPSEPRRASMPAGFGHSTGDPMMDWVRNIAMGGNAFPVPGYPPDMFCQQPPSAEQQAEMQRKKEEEARVNEERRVEMTVQDAEFQESLLIDQQRAEMRREEAEQERQLQEVKRQALEEAEAVFEAKRQRVSQPEADKAHPERCQIVIRTPGGKRYNRTFLGSDEVAFVYDWIDVCCADEPFTKSCYRLVSRVPGRPSKEISKNSTTLKEEGVEHQTMFFITSD